MEILTEQELFNSANIFADASITKLMFDGEEETIGCPGALLVLNGREIVDTRLLTLRHSTNNQSEATALRLAIDLALAVKGSGLNINIFSDSQISVNGLTKWIYGWANGVGPDGLMYSSSGSPVANQSILLDIMYTILRNDLKIRIFHQRGHVNQKVTLSKAKSTFQSANGILINDDAISMISYFNNKIDDITRVNLQNQTFQKCPKLVYPMEYSYTPQLNLRKYRKLIS